MTTNPPPTTGLDEYTEQIAASVGRDAAELVTSVEHDAAGEALTALHAGYTQAAAVGR